MSKERLQAIDEGRHAISGIILQLVFAANGQSEADLSRRIRNALVRIDAECAKLYDAGAEKSPAQPQEKKR